MIHVYATEWVAYVLDCGDAEQCRTDVPAYGFSSNQTCTTSIPRTWVSMRRAASFRSGSFPATGGTLTRIASSRSIRPGAWRSRQSRRAAIIARAVLYVMREYGLPEPRLMSKSLLRLWNEIDPVDAAERERNERIAEIQGNRNPFIDAPELADRF